MAALSVPRLTLHSGFGAAFLCWMRLLSVFCTQQQRTANEHHGERTYGVGHQPEHTSQRVRARMTSGAWLHVCVVCTRHQQAMVAHALLRDLRGLPCTSTPDHDQWPVVH